MSHGPEGEVPFGAPASQKCPIQGSSRPSRQWHQPSFIIKCAGDTFEMRAAQTCDG